MAKFFTLIYIIFACWFSVAVSDPAPDSTTTSTTTCLSGPEHPDYIEHLPGYDQPLPSHWYSGYVSYEFYNRTVHTHYMFIEAEDNSDGTKPIIYWSSTYQKYFIYRSI
jgi:Serine carboxypeptidase